MEYLKTCDSCGIDETSEGLIEEESVCKRDCGCVLCDYCHPCETCDPVEEDPHWLL